MCVFKLARDEPNGCWSSVWQYPTCVKLRGMMLVVELFRNVVWNQSQRAMCSILQRDDNYKYRRKMHRRTNGEASNPCRRRGIKANHRLDSLDDSVEKTNPVSVEGMRWSVFYVCKCWMNAIFCGRNKSYRICSSKKVTMKNRRRKISTRQMWGVRMNKKRRSCITENGIIIWWFHGEEMYR